MEYVTGKITATRKASVGTTLAQAHASGATTLVAVDPFPFDEDGGTLRVNEVTYTYTGWDDDTSTISLTTGLTAAAEAGDAVLLLPLETEMVAIVVEDESGEQIEADVRHSDASSLPEGPVVPPVTASLVFDGDRWLVDDIVGRTPTPDAGLLVGTLPPGMGTGPTEPPTTAPGITVTPFAAGAIQADWAPVDGARGYRVHASLVSPVPLDGSALVATTSASRFTLSDLNGDPVPMDGSLVYVVVEAINDLGIGPASAEGSAAARPADEFVSALFAYLGRVEAGQIDSGQIEADIAFINGSLTIGDPSTSHIVAEPGKGLVLYAADGSTPLVELRTDGQPSTFRGRVIADDISVLNGALLQGTANALSTNAVFTLQSAIADPQTPPALTAVTITQSWPSLPSGWQERGVFWNASDSRWYQLNYNSTTKVATYRTITAAGAPSASTTLEALGTSTYPEFTLPNGIVRIGDYIYVMRLNTQGTKPFMLIKYQLNGEVVWTGQAVEGESSDYACVGYNHSNGNLVIVRDRGTVVTYNVTGTYPTLTSQFNPASSLSNDIPIASKLSYVGIGNFDYGASRCVIGTNGTFHVATLSGGLATKVGEWSTDGTSWGGGWNGTNFFTQHNNGSLRRYSQWIGATGTRRKWVKVTNGVITPATKETAPSPSEQIDLADRRYLAVSSPPKDGQTTHYGYYLASTASDAAQPAASSFKRQGSLDTSANMWLDVFTTGGVTPPTASQFVGGGSPAIFKSQTGGLILRGDGITEVQTPVGASAIANKQYVDTTAGRGLYSSRYQAGVAQTITSGSYQKVRLDTAVATSDITWDGSDLSFTVPVAGSYLVSANLRWANNNTTGSRYIAFAVDGVQGSSTGITPPALTNQNVSFARVLKLTAGQKVSLLAFQSSGGTIALYTGSDNSTFMDIVWQAA